MHPIFHLVRSQIWPKNDWKTKGKVLGSVSLLVSGKVLNVQVPYIFKKIVESLNESTASTIIDPSNAHLTVPASLFFGYLAARTGSTLFQELKNVLFSRVSLKALRQVSLQAFNHLQSLDHSFHASKNTGTITKSLDRAGKGLSFLFNSLVFNIIPTSVEIALVSSLVGYKYGLSYAAISLSTVTVYSIFTVAVSTWRVRIRRKMNVADNAVANKALDCLTNHETIKAFTTLPSESAQFNQLLLEHQKVAWKSQSSLCLLNVGQSAIFSIAIATVMMKACNESMLNVGDLVFLNGLMIQLAQPLNFLGSIYREIRQAIIDIDGLLGISGRKPAVSEVPNAVDLVVKTGEIEFKSVSFDYEDESSHLSVGNSSDAKKRSYLIKDFSLKIPAGSKVAIVGESGCGKSTISRLLLRFWDPSAGSVLIDSQPISSVKLDSLRKQIGYVPQDITLFNDSIEYNIRYGNREATQNDIMRVSQMAQIDSVIKSLPKSYGTSVGERGVALSGGEKQRIAIARCFLKDAPIMILDEATSSLDSETEKRIVEVMMGDLMRGKTVIMIAHRLSSVRHADFIVVLGKEGRILEIGSHQQLISIPNGRYRSMCAENEHKQTKS